MKEIITFTTDTDVTQINVDAVSAKITLKTATDGTFAVCYPSAKNFNVACGDGSIYIAQGKFAFCKWQKQKIEISVPEHTVPEIAVNGKRCNLAVTSGIYKRLGANVDDGMVNVSGCAIENIEINGGDVNISLQEVTIKDNLTVRAERGDLLAENTFATRSDCKIKKGNIGLALVNCKNCSFDCRKGNITAAINGSEESFNTQLVTRDGTVNREGAIREGADGNFKAYTEKGNIVLDFVSSKEPLPETQSAAPEQEPQDGKESI